MSSFYFKAVAADGKLRTGNLSGESDKAVARELRKQGLNPVYVGIEQKKSFELKLPEFYRGRPQEISTLLNAGVPLDRALSITSELTEGPNFRTIVLDVLRVLKGGKSLADSLAAHPKYFGDLYVNMVRTGEASGALAAVFDRLAEFERSRDGLRGYIISSMTYPGLLMLVGLGSILVLLNFVVPRFASVFAESRMKIPLPTQMMLDASKIVQAYWLPATATVICLVFAFRTYIKTTSGRLWWDSLLLTVPMLGDAARKAETARFARAMSTLVANSVPLVQAIGIS